MKLCKECFDTMGDINGPGTDELVPREQCDVADNYHGWENLKQLRGFP